MVPISRIENKKLTEFVAPTTRKLAGRLRCLSKSKLCLKPPEFIAQLICSKHKNKNYWSLSHFWQLSVLMISRSFYYLSKRMSRIYLSSHLSPANQPISNFSNLLPQPITIPGEKPMLINLEQVKIGLLPQNRKSDSYLLCLSICSPQICGQDYERILAIISTDKSIESFKLKTLAEPGVHQKIFVWLKTLGMQSLDTEHLDTVSDISLICSISESKDTVVEIFR